MVNSPYNDRGKLMVTRTVAASAYFDCATLRCTLSTAACERNRGDKRGDAHIACKECVGWFSLGVELTPAKEVHAKAVEQFSISTDDLVKKKGRQIEQRKKW